MEAIVLEVGSHGIHVCTQTCESTLAYLKNVSLFLYVRLLVMVTIGVGGMMAYRQYSGQSFR